jgi:hypothetical protein
MDHNPYRSALDLVELLDEDGTEYLLGKILFDSAAREDHLQRQSLYLEQISKLPSGSDLLYQLM